MSVSRATAHAILAALTFFAAPVLRAQVATPAPVSPVPADSTVVHEIRLSDGSVLYGFIVAQDSVQLVVRTINGLQLDVSRTRIRQLRVSPGRIVGGEYWPEDPNHTRLLFTSTGRSLKRGEGYLSAYFLFVPMVAYGVTDRVTIAGGTPILPGAMGKAFYLAPKVSVRETERSAYSVGAISFALTESLDRGTVGLAYGVGTWGSRDRAVTAGAGWGYVWGRDGGDVASAPVVAIGLENRVSRRVKLLTENWIFSGSGSGGAVVSGGLRFIGDRLTADLGAIGVLGTDDAACCVPMVNFVWNFARAAR